MHTIRYSVECEPYSVGYCAANAVNFTGNQNFHVGKSQRRLSHQLLRNFCSWLCLLLLSVNGELTLGRARSKSERGPLPNNNNNYGTGAELDSSHSAVKLAQLKH